jgi:magnesium chelatase subunit D
MIPLSESMTQQSSTQILYPFSAVVGQEAMQLALLLNAINPAIGGVLIRGQKGTAKSTAARALAVLLPPLKEADLTIEMRANGRVESIPFSRPPAASRFIELPVGATDDRVVGTLDIEHALQAGQRRFEPGLLAQAHGGILYVDEVNLLADHIVDVLLDAAASGVNTVEREGISVSHPARFILVGTMNPEEGDLRPQLLDRFGLAVEVVGQPDPAARAEIVRRRIAYEANPTEFYARFASPEAHLRRRIAEAQTLLPQVTLSEGLLELITHICAGSGVDGLRADIVMYKAALTLAAWEARRQVTVEDVRRTAELALLHRRRRQPFEEPGLDQQQLDEFIQQYAPQSRSRGAEERRSGGESNPDSGDDLEGE